MKIAYVNLWGGFEADGYPERCFFTKILREIDPTCSIDLGMNGDDYDLVISMYMPIVGSRFYANMTQVKSKSICFTGESYDIFKTTPGCHAYIGFDLEEYAPKTVKYLRFPLYAAQHMGNLEQYRCSTHTELRAAFCNEKKPKVSAVVSNPSNTLRTSFLHHLVSNGLCVSGGALHNNIGVIDDKLKFTSEYTVGFAFENLSKMSYITEKIYDVFAANSIPLYWGASDIAQEFNPDSYVLFDAKDQETINKSIESMYSLLTDKTKADKMMKVDPFTGFRSEKYINRGKTILKEFIMNILESK